MGSYTKLIYIIFNKQNIFIKFIYWTLRVQMIAHLTRRINAPYRCSLKTLLFCINLDWKLSFLISKLIWTRSIFIPVVHKVNGKLQGFFHHEAMLHGEMSGVRAPLGAVRRPKRASTFSLVKRFFFLREKEMVQTPIISKIINIIWGHIQSI